MAQIKSTKTSVKPSVKSSSVVGYKNSVPVGQSSQLNQTLITLMNQKAKGKH